MDRVTVETMPSVGPGGTFHGERVSGTVLEDQGRKVAETRPFQGSYLSGIELGLQSLFSDLRDRVVLWRRRGRPGK